MPKKFKKFKDTAFVRKIRRALNTHGLGALVSWKPKPAFPNNLSAKLIETRISKSGRIFIMHHSCNSPATMADYNRILLNCLIEKPGATEAGINVILEIARHVHLCNEAAYPLITISNGNLYPVIYIPVRLVNNLRQPVEMVLPFQTDSKAVLSTWEARNEKWAKDQLEADGKRRLPDGTVKPLMVSATMASYLRSHEDGLAIAQRILPALSEALANYDYEGDAGQITEPMTTAQCGQTGFTFVHTGTSIRFKRVEFPGGMINFDTILIKGRAPETVLRGYAGKRLGDLVAGVPFNPELRIKQAKNNKQIGGISIKLDVKPVTLVALLAELHAAH